MGPVPSPDTPYTGCISFYQDRYSDVVVLPYNFCPSPDFSSLPPAYTEFASPPLFTPLSYFDDAYIMGDADTPLSLGNADAPTTMSLEGQPKKPPSAASASPASGKEEMVQQAEVLQPPQAVLSSQAMPSPRAIPAPQSMQSPQSLQSSQTMQPPQLVQQTGQMLQPAAPLMQQQHPPQMTVPSQTASPAPQQRQSQPQPPSQSLHFFTHVQVPQPPLVDPATLLVPEPREVMYALDIARESEEGAREPTVRKILEEAVERIWGYVLAEPETYVLTRDQFSVWNYFQARFDGNPVAIAARARFWRNYKLEW